MCGLRHKPAMLNELAKLKPAPRRQPMSSTKAPKCPWCAKPMTHVRSGVTLQGDRPKHLFECKRCIVSFAEVEQHSDSRAPERAQLLHLQPMQTLQ